MISRGPTLTEQVRQHISQQIAEEVYEDGRIPSEAELAEELGVSRTTIRDALSRLEHEGSVIRRQGAGTFVNEHGLQIKSRLDEVWSYEEVLEAHGYTPAVRVVSVATSAADEEDQAVFGDDGDVIVIEKLFLEDDEPVVMASNRVPVAAVDGDVTQADAASPIYEFLADRCGAHLAYYLTDVVPESVDAAVAERLGVEEGTAVVRLQEIGYDQDSQPIVRASSWFRDELLRFRMIRRKSPTT